jgi:hypothetical protein
VIDAQNIKKMEISKFIIDDYSALIQLVGNGLVSCITPPDVSKRQNVTYHGGMPPHIVPIDRALRISQEYDDNSISSLRLRIDRVRDLGEWELRDSEPQGKFLHEYEFGIYQTKTRHADCILRLAYGSKELIQYQAWICIDNGSELMDFKFRDGLRGFCTEPIFQFSYPKTTLGL